VNERTLANQDWFNDKNNLMEYCFPEKASRWTRLTRRRAVIDGLNLGVTRESSRKSVTLIQKLRLEETYEEILDPARPHSCLWRLRPG
jgi:hypothetical protein